MRVPEGVLFRQLCVRLKAEADQVVELWSAAAERGLWHELPVQQRRGALPDCVRSIADAMLCAQPDRETLLALARCAAEHGARRAAIQFDVALLPSEYYLLRDAMWSYFRSLGVTDDDAWHALVYVDLGITLATRAAMIGYHRTDFEREGRWPAALEELVDESLGEQLPLE